MSDARKPAGGPNGPPGPGDDLRACWNRFRLGDPVACPVDRAPLALAVDASAGTYRFVCTECGAASTWFESGPGGIQVRGQADDPPET